MAISALTVKPYGPLERKVLLLSAIGDGVKKEIIERHKVSGESFI